jgi:hypothetical protein
LEDPGRFVTIGFTTQRHRTSLDRLTYRELFFGRPALYAQMELFTSTLSPDKSQELPRRGLRASVVESPSGEHNFLLARYF